MKTSGIFRLGNEDHLIFNGNQRLVGSKRDQYENRFINKWVPVFDTTFRTIQSREGRANLWVRAEGALWRDTPAFETRIYSAVSRSTPLTVIR